jgi:hypothetical protein
MLILLGESSRNCTWHRPSLLIRVRMRLFVSCCILIISFSVWCLITPWLVCLDL